MSLREIIGELPEVSPRPDVAIETIVQQWCQVLIENHLHKWNNVLHHFLAQPNLMDQLEITATIEAYKARVISVVGRGKLTNLKTEAHLQTFATDILQETQDIFARLKVPGEVRQTVKQLVQEWSNLVAWAMTCAEPAMHFDGLESRPSGADARLEFDSYEVASPSAASTPGDAPDPQPDHPGRLWTRWTRVFRRRRRSSDPEQ